MPFLTIGSFIFGLFGKKNASPGASKWLGIAVLVIGLIVLATVAVKVHDHGVIATHDAKQDASNAKADRKADTKAADTRVADTTRLTTEEAQLKGVRENAPATQTATDRRRARHACIRLQQAARAEHRESPACGGPTVPGGAGRAH